MQAVGSALRSSFQPDADTHRHLVGGRYRSTLIQAERYLLACMVYMDLNPVRAGIAASAIEYPWSSHRHYAGARDDKLVTPHPLYWTLGNTPFAREARTQRWSRPE
jgi:putative transposase